MTVKDFFRLAQVLSSLNSAPYTPLKNLPGIFFSLDRLASCGQSTSTLPVCSEMPGHYSSIRVFFRKFPCGYFPCSFPLIPASSSQFRPVFCLFLPFIGFSGKYLPRQSRGVHMINYSLFYAVACFQGRLYN